jgi:hypothetical protein
VVPEAFPRPEPASSVVSGDDQLNMTLKQSNLDLKKQRTSKLNTDLDATFGASNEDLKLPILVVKEKLKEQSTTKKKPDDGNQDEATVDGEEDEYGEEDEVD